MNDLRTILVVDDDSINRQILVANLHEASYLTETAKDGSEAWEILQLNQTQFAAVLLDRLMPNMDGMELLTRIKEHPTLQGIPVIMQTFLDSEADILEGIEAGAFYYLIKPFDRKKLLRIIHAAVDDFSRHESMRKAVLNTQDALAMIWEGEFRLRTLDEARTLAAMLAHLCPTPNQVAMGLSELLFNAVEHGNLGITYAEKSQAITDCDGWEGLVAKRQSLTENANKIVRIFVERRTDFIQFRIVDEGNGFDWLPYLQFRPER
ncbi:MAG: response regulator, partial [Magnetococcales bacterium]|nr:response regulator [Magnetococcales bacterium]